jgi:hypothetical protein
MPCCIPWRKPVFRKETDLERGMLVEVVRIHKDGKEVYSRDDAPPNKRLYDHPSFALSQSRLIPLPKESSDPTPRKSIRQLRSELIQGLNEIEKLFD